MILEKGKELEFKSAEGLNNQKIICVAGIIQEHENKPQITISDPSKIESPCEVAARNPIKLNRKDQCILDVYIARCHWKDICYVDCFSRGLGIGLGGGCYHTCYAYTQDWSPLPPERYADCLSKRERKGYLKLKREHEEYEKEQKEKKLDSLSK